MNILSVLGETIFLDNKPFVPVGLRCSSALLNDSTCISLISFLDEMKYYGLNSFSVFLMGSRYNDVFGYREDGTLDPIYAERLHTLICEAALRKMVVIVGCLYWGESKAKTKLLHWTQSDAERAIANTALWLSKNKFYNVIIDPDNEGMAHEQAGFDIESLIIASKKVAPEIIVAANFKGDPPEAADIAAHFCTRIPGKPYVETEGTPSNAPGGYWSSYSRILVPGTFISSYNNYIRIGEYLPEMKADQINNTNDLLNSGCGYLFASTWLQAPPPSGPNYFPGGNGDPGNPGIRWWLDFIKTKLQT